MKPPTTHKAGTIGLHLIQSRLRRGQTWLWAFALLGLALVQQGTLPERRAAVTV